MAQLENYSLYLNGDVVVTRFHRTSYDPIQLLNACTNEKSYKLTTSDYRTIISAAILLARKLVYKIVFLTFTFQFDIDEKSANEVIKLFFKRLKRRYKSESYIWTKERTKNGRIHFHALIDLPFIPIASLQLDYNDCIRDITHFSGDLSTNSLRLPIKASVVPAKQVQFCARYIAKYIGKERFCTYSYPNFAISKNLYLVRRQIEPYELEVLKTNRGVKYEKQYDFCKIITLNNDF